MAAWTWGSDVWHLLRLVSLRHLRSSPLRSSLTVLGVAVGVATLVGVTAINRSVIDAFRSTVDTIAGKADFTVAESGSGFDETWLEKVAAVPGVTHATAALTQIAAVVGSPGESLFVMGLDFLDDGYFRSLEGADRDVGKMSDDLQFLNSTDRMLVSERFAAEHGLKVGDSFELATPSGTQKFVVHGLLKEKGSVKAFGGSVGVMFVASAQEAFHRGRRIDRIDVALDPHGDAESIRQSIVAALGPSFTVERPASRGASVEKMLRSFQMGLNLGSGVALMVGVFLVYNTVSIGVIQRRREIGTLRALGGTRRKIRALFALEAVVMGLVGTVLGLPFGALLARAAISIVSQSISALYIQVNARDVRISPVEISLGILLGVGGSAFAAWRPAMQASGVQPVEALRRDLGASLSGAKVRSWPTAVGALCLAAVLPATRLPDPIENLPVGGYIAVFLVIGGATLLSPLILKWLRPVFQVPGEWVLGISGRLAAENFSRAPGRTAVPVSALGIGVAMSLCIAGFVGSFQVSSDKWIDQSVPADLFVTSSAKLAGVQNTPMRPSLGDELEKIAGVHQVDRVRLFSHDLLGLRIVILSVIPEIYEQRGQLILLEGKLPRGVDRAPRHVSISENLARRRNLHPGDHFEMATATGTHTYWIDAVVIDYTSDQGTLLMDRQMFVTDFADDSVDTFELYLDDVRQAGTIRRTIQERFGRQHDLYVLTNNDLRQEAKDLVEGAFSITYAMEAVAVLLALLGVINTLLAAVIDRTREIGLLRAVGADRGHILRLFTAEAAFIGIAGGLIGALSGLLMGWIVTQVIGVQSTGWSFPYVFPTRIALQMFGASSVCALLAGLYPASRAAHLNVVDALAYE